MKNNFIHLRTHSRFSVGNSTLKIKDISALCTSMGMGAVALTDSDLMSGMVEFSDILPRNKIQPIVGIELTINQHNVDPKILRRSSLSKIVLLVQNHDGYLNLCELTRIMYMRQDNHHLGPFIDFDELKAHSAGLICLSGAHTGPLGVAVLNKQNDLAKIYANRLLDIFDNRFYIEIQRHGLDEEIKTEPQFLEIAKELNIPIVATNDVCFASLENFEATDALTSVLGQTKIIDPDRVRKSSQQYFKSQEEMMDAFSDLPEALENTIKISKRCGFIVNVNQPPLLPKFGSDIDEENKMLRDNTMAGLALRLEGVKDTEAYYTQAEFELETIINMGFPGYFLIVADYIRWARDNDILVGPGRGSGAGSVVSWALWITNVDPLEFGLLFERFLNPDRISMPDFDIDFEPYGREKVLEYLVEKYGENSVCAIITFGNMQARSAVRDIARVYGIPYPKSDRFSKMIPNDAKTLKSAIENSDEMQDFLMDDDDMQKVIDVAQELEGSLRNLGQHACGIVIGDRPTTEIAPVYRDPVNHLPSCQFDGDYLENVGLIKFDFLGLETLTVLKYATELIQKTRGINIDLDKIPKDDPLTFKLWQSGLTEGVFQFEAPFIQQTLRKMKPTSFLHISALNALNRPGPIAFIPQFIARMHGKEEVEYVHPSAEGILKETYGIIVYQEQVMQLVRVLAGFTRGESDNVRKAMGKKIASLMAQQKTQFLSGCKEHKTLDSASAEDLWKKFEEFANYAFNKSHSIAYSVIANQCAYLKANYAPEFLAAAMSSKLNDTDALSIFFEDAKTNFGIEIISPDINKSGSLFTVWEGKIIYALAALKGVGVQATDGMVAERNKNGKFKNLTDFAKRCAPFLNKRILESFARVGVLDSLEPNRAQIFMNADMILSYAAKSRETANSLSLFENTTEDDVMENRLHKGLSKTTPWGFGEKLSNELIVLGFYISAHPLDAYKKLIKTTRLVTSETLSKKADRAFVKIAVSVNSFARRKTKAGQDMITINASDSYGNIDAVAFGYNAADFAYILSNESFVLISGKCSKRDDAVSIFVDSITPLNEWITKVTKKITLNVKSIAAVQEIKKLILGLPAGETQVEMNIHSEKTIKVSLPMGVSLLDSTVRDFASLGVKVDLE